jgi:hypothetical protein
MNRRQKKKYEKKYRLKKYKNVKFVKYINNMYSYDKYCELCTNSTKIMVGVDTSKGLVQYTLQWLDGIISLYLSKEISYFEVNPPGAEIQSQCTLIPVNKGE